MKIHYVNFRRTVPNLGPCFKDWLRVTRYWSGKLIYIHVRHHALVIDLRKNWIADPLTDRNENL